MSQHCRTGRFKILYLNNKLLPQIKIQVQRLEYLVIKSPCCQSIQHNFQIHLKAIQHHLSLSLTNTVSTNLSNSFQNVVHTLHVNPSTEFPKIYFRKFNAPMISPNYAAVQNACLTSLKPCTSPNLQCHQGHVTTNCIRNTVYPCDALHTTKNNDSLWREDKKKLTLSQLKIHLFWQHLSKWCYIKLMTS